LQALQRESFEPDLTTALSGERHPIETSRIRTSDNRRLHAKQPDTSVRPGTYILPIFKDQPTGIYTL